MTESFGSLEPFDVEFDEEVVFVVAWESQRSDVRKRFDKRESSGGF